MPTADAYRRKYERAEAERLRLAEAVRDLTLRVNAGADDLQQQVDALEQLVLNRAALVSIEPDGRKLRLLFTRRGALHAVDVYNSVSVPLPELRKILLED